MRTRALSLLSAALLAAPLLADDQPAATSPTTTATIEVTATRVPEAVESVPASISVVTGDELRARNVHDLPGALSLVGGVSVAPGGDAGPASSVAELWGLREFDAFLLVVDGVPWGGAFNPAISSLDLTNVERIEVMRGAAPVMYGATSFVGVIHVIHRAAGAEGRTAEVWGGNYSSGGAAASLALPPAGAWKQSLSVNADKQGYRDDRTQVERGHVLYRGQGELAGGILHVDADVSRVNQKPPSPSPLVDDAFSDAIPLDANHNPSDGKIDQDRLHLVGGYDRALGNGSAWTTTLAVTHTKADLVRGFLADGGAVDEEGNNAAGFRQSLTLTDVYFDSHLALHPSSELQVVAGLDYLYGRGDVHGANFDYFVNLDGSGAPDSDGATLQEFPSTLDERNFAGLYAQAEWKPAPRWNLQLGARLNVTHESRTGAVGLGASGDFEPPTTAPQSVTRGSGGAGASYLLWDAAPDSLWVYGDVRDTFKPAAIDFGPEGEGGILKPEEATSYEVGLKGRHLAGRLTWDVSLFEMDFTNVVTSTVGADGLPELQNTGKQRFTGFEGEASYQPVADLTLSAAYSHHEPKFQNFVTLSDDPDITEPINLRGKQVEMSPRELYALGLRWSPARGLNASTTWSYVGKRFLDRENDLPLGGFSVWNAGLGYRFARYELRLDGSNLGDARDVVSESELGPEQFYREPARTWRLTLRATF
jgi:outer membrane receptor protein involved in Fe transport